MKDKKPSLLERLIQGEAIPMDHPQYGQIGDAVLAARQRVTALNQATDPDQIRSLLSEVIGRPVDATTNLFPPLFTNLGRNIVLGKRVFINHACSFLDLGGITIEDDVMVGPRVNITSENHPVDITTRKTLVPGPVRICRNAWIGAGATILPGVTVGANSVVAAGALVNKDVPPNTVVAGVPAKVVRQLT